MQPPELPEPHWDPALRVGVDIIDSQHEAIASLAAAVIKDPQIYLSSETGATFLTEFYRLVAFHFETEEQLMTAANAPSDWVEAHMAEHSALLEKIVSYSYDHTLGHDPKRVADIMEDLREIIVGHVVDYDSRFKELASALC